MKKVGYFFFCFLPLIASISLQFLSSFPIMGIIIFENSLSHTFSGQKISSSEFIAYLAERFTNPSINMTISVVYALFGILTFGFWYRIQFRESLQFPSKSFLKPGLVLGLILMVPGLQLASSILTVISSTLFPGWMDFYEKLIESAGFGQSPSFLLVLYAVILGPIAEELTFRGVTLSSAKKALPFWAANLFQALLFGVFHMNLIQGLYAFFIGLFLGYVCNRGGSIWLSVFLHMLFNFWGTFMTAAMESLFLILLFFPLGILGIILFHKNTSAKSIKYFPDFSDM